MQSVWLFKSNRIEDKENNHEAGYLLNYTQGVNFKNCEFGKGGINISVSQMTNDEV